VLRETPAALELIKQGHVMTEAAVAAKRIEVAAKAKATNRNPQHAQQVQQSQELIAKEAKLNAHAAAAGLTKQELLTAASAAAAEQLQAEKVQDAKSKAQQQDQEQREQSNPKWTIKMTEQEVQVLEYEMLESQTVAQTVTNALLVKQGRKDKVEQHIANKQNGSNPDLDLPASYLALSTADKAKVIADMAAAAGDDTISEVADNAFVQKLDAATKRLHEVEKTPSGRFIRKLLPTHKQSLVAEVTAERIQFEAIEFAQSALLNTYSSEELAAGKTDEVRAMGQIQASDRNCLLCGIVYTSKYKLCDECIAEETPASFAFSAKELDSGRLGSLANSAVQLIELAVATEELASKNPVLGREKGMPSLADRGQHPLPHDSLNGVADYFKAKQEADNLKSQKEAMEIAFPALTQLAAAKKALRASNPPLEAAATDSIDVASKDGTLSAALASTASVGVTAPLPAASTPLLQSIAPAVAELIRPVTKSEASSHITRLAQEMEKTIESLPPPPPGMRYTTDDVATKTITEAAAAAVAAASAAETTPHGHSLLPIEEQDKARELHYQEVTRKLNAGVKLEWCGYDANPLDPPPQTAEALALADDAVAAVLKVAKAANWTQQIEMQVKEMHTDTKDVPKSTRRLNLCQTVKVISGYDLVTGQRTVANSQGAAATDKQNALLGMADYAAPPPKAIQDQTKETEKALHQFYCWEPVLPLTDGKGAEVQGKGMMVGPCSEKKEIPDAWQRVECEFPRHGRLAVLKTDLSKPTDRIVGSSSFKDTPLHQARAEHMEQIFTTPGLGVLDEANLMDNGLGAIPRGLTMLHRLKKIRLCHNQLSDDPRSTPAESLMQMTMLEQLECGYNEFTAIPQSFCMLSWLKNLDLTSNDISSIPPEITLLTSLEILCLGGNCLTSIPVELFDIVGLTKLDLFNNALVEIPGELGKLESLRRLNVSGNQLEWLPAEAFFTLRSLEMLQASRNNLLAVPHEFGFLEKLEHLHIDQNQLSTIPAEIGALTELQALRIDRNQLSSIPADIGLLPKLIELLCDRNEIVTLPASLLELVVNKRAEGVETFRSIRVDDHVIHEPSSKVIFEQMGDVGVHIDQYATGRTQVEVKLMKRKAEKAKKGQFKPSSGGDNEFSALASSFLNQDTRDLDDLLADLGEVDGGKGAGGGKKKGKGGGGGGDGGGGGGKKGGDKKAKGKGGKKKK
jgi:Leucine-rich repeat (LRR) protein